MAKNPLRVGSVKKLIAAIGDQVLEDAKKFKNQAHESGQPFQSSGGVQVNGKFAYDEDGDLGVVGNVLFSGPPIEGELEGHAGPEWDDTGQGTIEVYYTVRVGGGQPAS